MAKRKKDGSRVSLRQRMAQFKQTCLMIGAGMLRLLYVCTWVAMAAGSVYGLGWCREHTLGLPEYRRPAGIRLTNLPNWLRRPENKHVVDQILSAARVDPATDHIVDSRLTGRVARSLKDCPWVEQVVSIRKLDRAGTSNGTLIVECTYRMPTAWVQQEDRCYLIDGQGCRLPGAYDPYEAEQAGLTTILGVAASPPDVGQTWSGEDLQAGLRLAGLLPAGLRSRIAAVDIANYRGRMDPLAPDIKLQPRQLSSEIFWGHAPDEEFEMELSALDKVRLLEDNLKRYGRVDGNRAYLDIRTTPPYQPVDRPGGADPKAGSVARQGGAENSHA